MTKSVGGTGAVPSQILGQYLDKFRDQHMEEIGRKHPIHLDVHDRRDAPIIVFLTVCTKDRKAILASWESHALLIDAWRAAKMWQVGTVRHYA